MTYSKPTQIRTLLFAFASCFVLAFSALAALSPSYQEWRNGPVQWIMSPEEQKAWKSVKGDDEAVLFIDLFWVRRDPTAGTARNEFRDEFDQRVRFADEKFVDRRTLGTKKRGALTDRGRVYIVLGAATNMGAEMSHTTTQRGGSGEGPTAGGRAMGARDVWEWDHTDAQKFDMPKIEVVFIEDPDTLKIQRDPQRRDFLRAGPVAIQKAIVNPDLKEVPDWAVRGGLEPKIMVEVRTVPTRVIDPPASSDAPATDTVPDAMGTEQTVTGVVKSGASRLTLLRDASQISPESKSDPFANASSVDLFHKKDNLGWVAQFCSPAREVPMLNFIVRLSGPAGDDSTDRVTPPRDVKPPRLKAVPGCYLLSGAMPLSKMSPGTYRLILMLEDTTTVEDYTLQQTFRLE